MKIKKLAALALASIMVFSMAACGGSKDDKKSASKANDVSVDTVVEAFEAFSKEQDKNYSVDTTMIMKMTSEGMEMNMETFSQSSSYDGVNYTKTTTKMDMAGMQQETVDEVYTIEKEDGVVTEATKTSDDEEWEVDTYEIIESDEEEEVKLDVEALKKSAKMETKGDECFVTMEVSGADMDLGDDAMMGDMSDMKLNVVVTYNAKDSAITGMEVKMDLDAINEMMKELGDIEVSEFQIKMENIKKTEKAIEIPAEIELD